MNRVIRPQPVIADVLDSLRALGGEATTAELVEHTGRTRELVAKALRRAGLRPVGRSVEPRSKRWRLP